MKRVSVASFAIAAVTSPALLHAQDHHITAIETGPRAPAGASATVNLRIPLGGSRESNDGMRFDMRMSMGQMMEDSTSFNTFRTRSVDVAKVSFDRNGPRDVSMANFKLTDFGREDIQGPRDNIVGGGASTLITAVGAAVIAILLVGALDGDDDEDNPPQ